MSVQLTFTGKDRTELHKHIGNYLGAFADDAPETPKAARLSKAKPAAPETDDEDATFSDDEAEEVETEEEEEEATTYTLKQVQEQARKYAAKFGEEKTIAKLKKLGHPNLKKAPESAYEALIIGLRT